MKHINIVKILFIILFITTNIIFGAPNPFADDSLNDNNDSIFDDDYSTNTKIDKSINLNALQLRFWSKNRTADANVTNIPFKAGETYSIRTRANMITTIILDNDKIAFVNLGDNIGFEIQEAKNGKYNLDNILMIKPNLIGVDTNLTIIGESGNIYSFYLFSTDYKNTKDPAFVVFVSEFRQIGKIAIENTQETEKEKAQKELEILSAKYGSNDEFIESESDTELIIGDRVNRITINKSEIRKNYIQDPRNDDSQELMAREIFNDNKWTYFKFDRNLATSKFPAIFRVVDGYDNPMNSRVVGNYIIVETIANKWTMRIGDQYVCVRKKGND